MFSSLVLIAIACNIAAGFDFQGDVTHITGKEVPYRGPPAPLNHDGTVAFTPEFHEASAVHNAAYLEEYQRLQAAEDLAKAHPDLTSPPEYKSQGSVEYSTQHEDGEHSYETEQAQYTLPYNQHAQGVPHTPEYNAIAAALEAARSKNHGRHRRSIRHYQPAPLNHDGTVANTPEIEQAIAAHYAAYNKQHQMLQEAKNLADAHPDLSSHDQYETRQYDSHQQDDGYDQSGVYDYNLEHNNGQYLKEDSYPAYNIQQNDDLYSHNQLNVAQYSQEPSYSHTPVAHVPAPLNHDGTVAHTEEYKAVAAAHQAEYSRAALRAKYSTSVASSRSHPTLKYGHY
ncbi:uncharacterized protein [Halyomorpha halys]|uniref:uncharacterized protein n=1 Tax=Halyomorpha halys TaxID=286706 RepID=UPI0006D503AB|nr:uncharacterized protein LOC106685579 [Halyomorpha halys]